MHLYDLQKYPIDDLESQYVSSLKSQFEDTGFIAIENFILPDIVESIKKRNSRKEKYSI